MPTTIVLPEWVLWVQALGPSLASAVTGLVAIAVAVVAFRQWQTAHRKLKLDLFHVRYAVYEDLMKAALEIPETLASPNANPIRAMGPKLDALRYAILRAEVLFPEEVTRFIPAIYAETQKAFKLAQAHATRPSDNIFDLGRVSDIVGISVAIGDAGKVLANAMKPYLRIQDRL